MEILPAIKMPRGNSLIQFLVKKEYWYKLAPHNKMIAGNKNIKFPAKIKIELAIIQRLCFLEISSSPYINNGITDNAITVEME